MQRRDRVGSIFSNNFTARSSVTFEECWEKQLREKIYENVEKVKKKDGKRYLFVFLAMLFILCGQVIRIVQTMKDHSYGVLILLQLLGDILGNCGKIIMIFMMLISKCKPIRYLLTMRGFTLLSHLLLPIMLLMPIMFLRYYYELH
jgi:hypothetical protein